MKWISVKEKMPPLYKEVLLFFNNGAIVNGHISATEAVTEHHINFKYYVGIDPKETTVVYWCDLPEFPETKQTDKNGD